MVILYWMYRHACLVGVLAKNAVNDTTRPLMMVLFAAIAMGFMSIYAFGWRKDAPETFGETGVVWWNHLRPIHAFCMASLYGCCTLAMNTRTFRYSWIYG